MRIFRNLRNFVNFRFYYLSDFFPVYFRCFRITDFVILKSFFQIFLKELSKWLAIQSQIIWCKDFVILCDPFTSFVFIIWGSLNPQFYLENSLLLSFRIFVSSSPCNEEHLYLRILKFYGFLDPQILKIMCYEWWWFAIKDSKIHRILGSLHP